MGTGWAFRPLPFPYTCHALAARKYWRVRMDPNPNISSAASVWPDQTPSIAINIGSFFGLHCVCNGFTALLILFFIYYLHFSFSILFMFFIKRCDALSLHSSYTPTPPIVLHV